MTSLNDLVFEWGVANGYATYGEAKAALTDGLTQDQVADSVVPSNWNDGLYGLADVPAVLREATLWLDAQYSEAGEQVAVNQGSGGSALDATYGSTAGADTNDPLFLPWNGENYVHFPGINGNTLTTPDFPALGITGDIEIVFKISTSDWSPGTSKFLLGKWGLSSTRSWYFLLSSASPHLRFSWTPDGSGAAAITIFPNAALPFVDGRTYWLKTTLDVDNGAAGNSVNFYYAEDQAEEPSSWIQIGTTVVTPGTTSIFDGPDALDLGHVTATPPNFDGQFYNTIVRNGIGGPTVFEFNAQNDITTGQETSFVCTSGQTVTVNRATSGRKTALVTRPVWLFGTDDYLGVADNALLDFGTTEDVSVMAVWRAWSALGATNFAAIAKGDSNAMTSLYSVGDSVTGRVQGLWAAPFASSTGPSLPVAGSLKCGVLNIDRTAQRGTIYQNGLPDLTPGVIDPAVDLTSTKALTVGAYSEDTFSNGEIVAVAVWDRVLTTDEIAAINTFYGTA